MVIMEWMKELLEFVQEDPEYQEKLEAVKQTEPAFLALREMLTEEQRQVLDEYLSAWEELDHELLSSAELLLRSRFRREVYGILRLEATYQRFYRQRRGAPPVTWKGDDPEFREKCRQFNEAAKQVMEETGEELPLVEWAEE